MALRQFNPITASLRGTVLINRSELWKGKPVKALTEGKQGTGGRNNHGHITSALHRRRAQAVVSLSSTSSGASSMCRRRWSGWNTTRTAPPSSRW